MIFSVILHKGFVRTFVWKMGGYARNPVFMRVWGLLKVILIIRERVVLRIVAKVYKIIRS